MHFLHSVGCRVSKQTVVKAELLVCRELQFILNAPDPLTFVETLLEVLGEKSEPCCGQRETHKQQLLFLSAGHNMPSVPMVALYHLSQHVLQFVTLQRSNIFQALLAVSTCCASPSDQLR